MENYKSISVLHTKLEEYKSKFYLNKVLKGALISAAIVLATYLIFNTLEFFAHFGTTVRTILFYSFCGILLYTFFTQIARPLVYLLSPKKPINDAEAAIQIGRFFPEINDKLLNTLQLSTNVGNNELIRASIDQKTKQLGVVRFTDAIKIEENKKYLKYAFIPAGLILAILAIYPTYFAESSKRIVNFKNEFAQPAPFQFLIKNKDLSAFKNEDFTINLLIVGKSIPQDIYLLVDERKIHLESTDAKNYSYTFRNIQKPTAFTFEAAGFNSATNTIKVLNRPSLNGMMVHFTYPSYLKKQNTTLENSGNFTIPEGTLVEWEIGATDTDSVNFNFGLEKSLLLPSKKSFISGDFSLRKQIRKSTNYLVKLYNSFSTNKDASSYTISVIPDNFPTISLEQFKDTTLYNYIVLGGKIADDIGLSQLKVMYTIEKQGAKPRTGFYNIGIDKSQNIQSFYQTWMLDSLKLNPGDKLNYYVQVSDNDGVNGPKSTKSEILEYLIPSTEKIEKNIENSLEKTEEQLDKTLNNAEKLKNELANLEKRLKNNPELNYQDKKLVDELLKKKEDLINEIKALQEQFKVSTDQQKRFDELKPELMEKLKQLDNLIKELLDEETKKMYENLKEQLEKRENEKMLDQLDKLKNKERNLEKELERAMKLFKKLEKEQKVDKAIKDLLEQAKKEENLAEKTEQKDPAENNEELKNKQEEISKDFEKTKEELDEAEKLSEELKEDDKLDTDKKSQEEISNDQKKSKSDMEKKDNKKAAASQKKAAQKMKNLAEKLESQKESQEAIETEENIDDLRQIMENLVKLSFDQEKLMKDFRNIRIGDPRFLKLGQTQIKLKDDAKIIEDSLYALANRVFQIKSFVTREVGLMKYHMDESSESIKERKLNTITARQQFAMTSMNNLALLLSDVLSQMQMSMMDMSGKGKGKKKGNMPLPSMSEMQQKLNQKMQGKSGKDGKNGKDGKGGESEELAKLAQEQGRIRRMLQELLDGQKGNEIGKQLDDQVKDLIKKMDQTETDIVNKQITKQTLNRQKEIETRLLESEKALKQQEEDEKRKAETASEIPKTIPKELEEYVKTKQKQTELIRTVPAALSPFYKKEVDNYFKRINK
ncbi:MAG: ATPase [Bacteroidota bacterium]